MNEWTVAKISQPPSFYLLHWSWKQQVHLKYLYLHTCHIPENSNPNYHCFGQLKSHSSHCSWGCFCFEGEENLLEFVSADLPSPKQTNWAKEGQCWTTTDVHQVHDTGAGEDCPHCTSAHQEGSGLQCGYLHHWREMKLSSYRIHFLLSCRNMYNAVIEMHMLLQTVCYSFIIQFFCFLSL